MSFLEAVHERVVVYDGAIGTNLHRREPTIDDYGGAAYEGCVDLLSLTRPDFVTDLHESFFEVGADVVETNTFGAFGTVLAEYGLQDRAHEMCLAAARLAARVRDDFNADGRHRFVAGSMGPGTKLPSLGHVGFVALRDAYEVMARGLIEGGVDVLLIETCYDLLQAKAAVIGARRAMAAEGRRVPIQLQVTMETTGRMLVGSEIGAALVSLGAMKPDLFGLNCATGPREMTEHLRHLSQHCSVPISVLPNAGLPSIVHGQTHYDLTPDELAEYHARFITDFGVRVVGGCCGTTPAHIAAVIERCRDLTPTSRPAADEPSVSSLYTAQPIAQDTSFLIIGERTNANGSKAFRDAMLAGDWDASVRMAGDQIREGAHVLDVCVDYVGRDGAVDMDALAGRLATQASAAARVGLHRTQCDGGGPASHRRARHPQLGQPRGRLRRGLALRSGHEPRSRVRRRGDLPADRRGRPGARCRVEDARRPPHPRSRGRALRHARRGLDLRRAHVPVVDGR